MGTQTKTWTHTPGPWIVNGQAIETTDDADGQSYCLAHVYAEDDNGPAEHVANARLIAAAPEMLEALRLAEWTLANLMPALEPAIGRGVYFGCDPGRALRDVRSILTRVEGR